jgi:phospho-N-acetylmuramoyl-pentapeptide-transferase
VGIAFLVAIAIGPVLIPTLYKLKFGQYIRTDGPQRHLKKAGTPTMGGLMFLAGMTVGTLVIGPMNGPVLLVLGTTLAFGLIGFIDDYVKVVVKRPLGLRAREKLGGQFGVAIVVSLIAVFAFNRGTDLVVPFIGYKLTLGPLLYLVFSTLIIVGTTNAVNLTDGLDGLAAGCMAISAAAFAFAALILNGPAHDVAIPAAALVGGCLGFLRFNIHPARIFMGDTGSLALGGALASLAVITGTELLLPFMGVIYLVETLSVIVQVISFKLTGKRVFRMSPIHHHFELAGWSEQKVVRVFWIVCLFGAIIGILGLPGIG